MDLFAPSDLPPFAIPQGKGYKTTYLEAVDGFRIRVPHGELWYVEHFFSPKISDRSVAYFQENTRLDSHHPEYSQLAPDELAKLEFVNINWKQDYLNLYGKPLALPRLTAWYGDTDKVYTYSGITSVPNAWNAGLLYMKREVEAFAGVAFNSVLLNWYRDGDDHMGWHADDEDELGENPTIASISFGTSRDFVLRNNADKTKKLYLPLKHGTLLLMKGALQHYWQHSVPKRRKINASRFNLTFRYIH